MKKSKLLAFAVVAVMLIAAMCATAFAAEVVDSGTCGENLTWTLDSDGLLTISGTGEMTSNPWADNHKEDIKHVVISDGVTTIGYNSFDDCTSLSSVTIPDSVTTIHDFAFAECKSMENVTIPDGVKVIGNYAFRNCDSLTSVTIPSSVKEIDSGVFESCDSLTQIQVDAENLTYSSYEGVLFNKDMTLLIQAPGTITEYSIPEGVTTIGYDAFLDCVSLTSVTIPDSAATIGVQAFTHCESLTSVIIPDGVTTIDSGAFYNCYSLTSVTIPESVTEIGSYVFLNCESLASVTIPSGVTELKERVFINCNSLTSVTLSDSVTTIDGYAFWGCESLTSVTIPDSVTTIGNNAFGQNKSLSTIVFKGNCPAIDESAFYAVTAKGFYPIGNPTWTEDKLQDYGGHITWMPYDSAADIIADTVTVYSGENQSADVDISYIGEGEISSVRLTIDSALPISSVTSDYCIEYNPDENCALIWKDEGESFGNGIIMTVHFDLNAEPTPDDGEYDVNLVIEDVTDADGETIELTAQSGKVIIMHRAGDVNLDGIVDNRDVVMIARYLVRITKFDEKQIALADYNGDGQVSNSDLVMVCRSLVGLD